MSDKKACSKIEKRSVIKFLVAEVCKTVEIHRRMSTMYASKAQSPKFHFLRSFANSCVPLKQVKKDIKNKHRGHQSKGVILHHDNARPHTADHQQPGLETAPSSPLQQRPCLFRLSLVWSFERVHEETQSLKVRMKSKVL